MANQLERSHLVSLISAYNAACKETELVRIVNRTDEEDEEEEEKKGLPECRGLLRLHWDVGSVGVALCVDQDELEEQEDEKEKEERRRKEEEKKDECDSAAPGVQLRRSRGFRAAIRRRRSFRGREFSGPPLAKPGSHSAVVANLKDTVNDVLTSLFAKFRISEPVEAFALVLVGADGCESRLEPVDCPLIIRLGIGPSESTGRLVVRRSCSCPSQQQQRLMCLPNPLLNSLLNSLTEEEAREIEKTKENYRLAREAMLARMAELTRCQ